MSQHRRSVYFTSLIVLLAAGAFLGCKKWSLNRECTNGNDASCEQLAGLLLDSSETEERDRAVSLFHQTCRSGSDSACRRWMSLHSDKKSSVNTTGIDMLEASCKRGVSSACEFVEEALTGKCGASDNAACDRLRSRSPAQPSPSVLLALERHCTSGRSGTSCTFVFEALKSQFLDQAKKERDSGGKEPTAAQKEAIHDLIRRGRLVAETGCGENVYPLCTWYGYIAEKDEARRTALAKACGQDKGVAVPEFDWKLHPCGALARLQWDGAGGPQDRSAAARSASRACDDSASECLDAARMQEMLLWDSCRSSLRSADDSQVTLGDPVLMQEEHTITSSYTTPDRYVTVMKERGIFVREPYLETTRIPGKTIEYSRNIIDRYAAVVLVVKNDSDVTVNVSVRATFDFTLGDSIARGAFGALVVGGIAALAGAKGDELRDAALAGAAIGAVSGKSATGRVQVSPGELALLSAEVDTQSVFGNNRKMRSVRIDSVVVSFPDGRLSRPRCATDLRRFAGSATTVKTTLKRACDQGKSSTACRYLSAVEAGNDTQVLRSLCGPTYFPQACERVTYRDYLEAE